jgi:probable F420-dependent oxidoreductase
MKLGFNMPQLTDCVTQKTIHDFAVRADELGYDSLVVQDHYLYPENPIQSHPVQMMAFGPEPVMQWPQAYEHLYAPLESLAYVAGITKNIRLGTSILVLAYHRPVMLAKRTATIDVLSNGRLDLGLGLGWAREEFDHMDTPFGNKGSRATDFIRAMKAAWADNPTEYNGEYFNFPKGSTSPKPVQQDLDGNTAVPIMGAFNSEPGRDRLAELCDIWHPAGLPADMAMMLLEQVNQLASEKYNRGPLAMNLRVFAAPSLPGIGPVGDQLMPSWMGGIDDMLPLIKQCKDAGVHEVTIDTSFTAEINTEEAWLQIPDFFAPLLEEAHK